MKRKRLKVFPGDRYGVLEAAGWIAKASERDRSQYRPMSTGAWSVSYSSYSGGFRSHSACSSSGGMLYGLSLDPRCQHNEQARRERYQQMAQAQMNAARMAMNPSYQTMLRNYSDIPLPEAPKRESVPLAPHPYEYGGTVPEADRYKAARPIIGWLLTLIMLGGVVAIGWYVWQKVSADKIAATIPVESPVPVGTKESRWYDSQTK